MLVLNGIVIISYWTIVFHIQLCISFSYIVLYNYLLKKIIIIIIYFLFLQNVRQHYTSRISIAAYICCEGTTFMFFTGAWPLLESDRSLPGPVRETWTLQTEEYTQQYLNSPGSFIGLIFRILNPNEVKPILTQLWLNPWACMKSKTCADPTDTPFIMSEVATILLSSILWLIS